MTKIIYTDEYLDERGTTWFSINGEKPYNLSNWTKAQAIADFLSPESEMKRYIGTSYLDENIRFGGC